jgi:RNA polymerase sigma-70 factor (ECF subfamily)
VIAALAVLVGIARDPGDGDRECERDAELLARHRAGEPAAFEALYRAHAAAVYRRLSRILGPVPERDDLMQDVFLAVHRALPRFRGDARLATLIQRITINRAYDLLRRRSRRPAVPTESWQLDELIGPWASPEAAMQARDDAMRVFACLAKIKPKKRIALLLRVVENLSFDQIGELVDATPETVAKRVQCGQRELEALLARAEQAEREAS